MYNIGMENGTKWIYVDTTVVLANFDKGEDRRESDRRDEEEFDRKIERIRAQRVALIDTGD